MTMPAQQPAPAPAAVPQPTPAAQPPAPPAPSPVHPNGFAPAPPPVQAPAAQQPQAFNNPIPAAPAAAPPAPQPPAAPPQQPMPPGMNPAQQAVWAAQQQQAAAAAAQAPNLPITQEQFAQELAKLRTEISQPQPPAPTDRMAEMTKAATEAGDKAQAEALRQLANSKDIPDQTKQVLAQGEGFRAMAAAYQTELPKAFAAMQAEQNRAAINTLAQQFNVSPEEVKIYDTPAQAEAYLRNRAQPAAPATVPAMPVAYQPAAPFQQPAAYQQPAAPAAPVAYPPVQYPQQAMPTWGGVNYGAFQPGDQQGAIRAAVAQMLTQPNMDTTQMPQYINQYFRNQQAAQAPAPIAR